MRVIVISRTGANSVRTELETDKFGNIEIPAGLGEVHNLYGNADDQVPEFRMFRTIPERALATSRKVSGRNDKHQLSADVLPEPPSLAKFLSNAIDEAGGAIQLPSFGGPTTVEMLDSLKLPEPDVTAAEFITGDESKGELIAIAEGLGVHTVPDSMTVEDLKDAIEDATEPEPFEVEPEVEPEPVKPKKKATKKAAASVPPPDKGKKKSPK